MRSFDYVIIGAGSAGSCLANRLSANGKHSICLIEAGPRDNDLRIKIPLALVNLMKNPKYNWLFRSTPQVQLNDQQIPIPRGKTLGGSSSINSMVYIRGRASDYDRWSKLGAEGWEWDKVQNYFIKSENNTRFSEDPLHGNKGLLDVQDPMSPHPLCNDFIAAGGEIGMPENNDFNGTSQEGMGVYQLTMRKGRRCSSADAFLKPALARSNLHVITGAEVERIKFDGHRAKSIQFQQKNKSNEVSINRELILSAGAIGSPVILFKSGLGPLEVLQKNNIQPVQVLNGVGENLQDHPACALHFSSLDSGYGLSLSTLHQILMAPIQYLLAHRGLFASNTVEAGGFARTDKNLSEPDVQFHFIPARVGHGKHFITWGRGYYADVCLLKPNSRGRLWVDKAGEKLVPKIDLNLLSDENDMKKMVEGFKLLRRIFSTTVFLQFNSQEVYPGDLISSEQDIESFLRSRLGTAYHPVGTCRMGKKEDPGTVVDSNLRLCGIENIRVADASVMPEIVAGNTNAPSIMIAEKASDMILESQP